MFHWSFIPWGFYLVLAAAFGFMLHVRKRERQKYSEACRPLLGKHTDGLAGKIIDLLAVFALLAGTATTFSVATPLMAEVVSELFHVEISRTVITIIILLLTCLVYTYSLLHGFKGISFLAKACIYLFFGLLVFVLLFGGETKYIIESGFASFGKMIGEFVELSMQDEAAGVYDVDLARLWSSRWQNDFSFPQFKYLLYTHSDKLPLNTQLHLTPAMQLTLEWHANADARFSVLLRALKEIFFEAARSGQYLYDRNAAARLVQATGLSSTRATSAVRVVLAAVQSWQQHSPRLQRTRVLRRGTTQEGAEYSVVDPFISEFFHWLEQSFAVLHSGETCRYLPVNDSAQSSERLTPALGVLEELDLLHFALLGGSNSRLYLYINQTQTLELADRGFYRNHLLERIAQRHTDAVRLMSWLFTSGFSSEQLWDRIEEYFLGLPIQGFDAPSAESR